MTSQNDPSSLISLVNRMSKVLDEEIDESSSVPTYNQIASAFITQFPEVEDDLSDRFNRLMNWIFPSEENQYLRRQRMALHLKELSLSQAQQLSAATNSPVPADDANQSAPPSKQSSRTGASSSSRTGPTASARKTTTK
jgi:hypothetical protein